MQSKRLISMSLIGVLLMVACVNGSQPAATFTNGGPRNETREILRRLTLLYTNDEHGWMEPTEDTGGAAGLMGIWRQKEGYAEEGPFLILSGGDMKN